MPHNLTSAYIPGESPQVNGPLARFLPPVPSGISGKWLERSIPPGSWVLDPFGVSPEAALDAADRGYRVLAAVNNPILRLFFRIARIRPRVDQLQSVVAEIGASAKGSERLEPHIRAQYLSTCTSCGREVLPEAFIWDKDVSTPVTKIYTCPSCGDDGERPVSQVDLAVLDRLPSSGLHRARAVERIAAIHDPDRHLVEEMVAYYQARPLYIMLNLVNKLDQLQAGRLDLACALLLPVLDQASTLWPWPSSRARPRQMVTPPRYRESNLWLALEKSVEQWKRWLEGVPQVPVTTWPELPPAAGGVCLFEGRLRDFSLLDPEAEPGRKTEQLPRFACAMGVLPRPNQAFWTLSALWAGWLWGREAAVSLRSVFHRRRYDWPWLANALHSTLQSLTRLLPDEAPIFGLQAELEAGALTAALSAAALAGYHCQAASLRACDEIAQVTWSRDRVKNLPVMVKGASPRNLELLIQQAAREHIQKVGEPVRYLTLHTAILLSLEEKGKLSETDPGDPADTTNLVQAAIHRTLIESSLFTRLQPSSHSIESGAWWLASSTLPPAASSDPLADRVEMALVRWIQQHPGAAWEEIDQACCSAFPGVLTPDTDLVRACLDSYGEQQPGFGWKLRQQDLPKTRREELGATRVELLDLGRRLGCTVTKSDEKNLPLTWTEQTGGRQLCFFLTASAVIGEVILNCACPPAQSVLVCPGGRAGLIAYKIENNALLKLEIEKGWRFLKFRHLRRLIEDPFLTLDGFIHQLDLDPLTNQDPQLRMF